MSKIGSNKIYKFEEYIEYFNKIKANSTDYEKYICSKVINKPVEKILFFNKNELLNEWLKQNFYKYERTELYIKVTDLFLAGKFGDLDRVTMCEQILRTVLAIATQGVVSTPVEGLSEIYIGKNSDNTQYLGIKYAGPIRAAGATAGGLTVIVAVYISKKLNLIYKPSRQEIERYKTECGQYTNIHPQIINPKDHQIEVLVNQLNCCIDGVAAQRQLVNVHRYIERVSTPFLRGGAMLIFCVLIIKAKKIAQLAKTMGLNMEYLIDIYNASKFNVQSGTSSFLNSIVAGRTVFSMPKLGGFRLRLGRSRNTGLGSVGISPITMHLLKFLNLGSQLMISGPGKAATVAPVTDLQSPTVQLNDGSVVYLDSENLNKNIDNIRKILDLGELLVGYGQFLQNKLKLQQIDHCMNYWRLKYDTLPTYNRQQDLSNSIKNNWLITPYISPITVGYDLAHWKAIRKYLIEHSIIDVYKIDAQLYTYLKYTRLNYSVNKNIIEFEFPELVKEYFLLDSDIDESVETVYDMLVKFSSYTFPKKGSFYIGARLAAVQASGMSEIGAGINLVYKIKSPSYKILQQYCEKMKVQKVNAKSTWCKTCEIRSVQRFCKNCHKVTELDHESKIQQYTHDMIHDLVLASKRLGIPVDSHKIRVSHELDRSDHWEPFEKGILRTKHGLHTFRDGVVHFTASNIVLTQFKPIECGMDVDCAIKLGYTTDIYGEPLTNSHQILELKVQDIIMPLAFSHQLLKVTKYVDELLVKYYKTKAVHNCKTTKDLIGLNLATIAPHILNGTCCRLIGFMNQNACYRHPVLVAGCRRNADGDRDSYVVLSNLLLDYSDVLLKNGNGRYMNVFAILSTELYITSVDKEVTNLDISNSYNLELYETRNLYASAIPVATAGKIKPGEQYCTNYGFNTPTETILTKTPYNAYKQLVSLEQKIDAQLEIAEIIEHLDLGLVLSKVIDGHLIKDIIGNSRKFLRQGFRCTKCNISYLLLPLDGKCKKCEMLVNYTVHPKSAIKYVDLITKYKSKFSKYLSTYMNSAIIQTINQSKNIIKFKQQVTGFKKFI